MPEAPRDDEMPDAAMAEAFRESEAAGVLDRLGAGASRLLLREPPSDAPSPILRPVEERRAGRYQVLGEIARGGVGVVLKGHDNDLGRDVAMKLLRDEHARNPDVVQRFVEEAQIGGQLQHPGIVPVYELGVRDDGTPYFAMKLVKGRTLSALLADRKDLAQDRRRFVGVFEQVCQTMAYAHSRGVVHRDLKPSNVMVGAFGEVQVVDWGLAKVLRHGGVADEKRARAAPDVSVIATVRSGSTGSESVVGSVLGTPAYMPPEQARGKVDELDERSDVFSLGAVLCEILTGKPPYVADGRETLLMAAQAKLDDAFARLDACGADEKLIRICKGCLVAAPAARPLNASELAEQVSVYLAAIEERVRHAQIEAAAAKAHAEEAEARAAVERDRRRHEQRARRMTLALAAVVLVAVVAGGAVWWRVAAARAERLNAADRAVAAAMEEAELLHRRAGSGQDLRVWDEAEAAARRAEAVASAPDVPEPSRARIAAFRRDFDLDIANVRAAADADRRAADLSRGDDTPGAIAAVEEAVRRLPRHAAFRVRLSGLHVRSARWRLAEQTAAAAVALDPENAFAWEKLTTAAFMNQDHDVARRGAEQQIRLQPDNARAYINLGNACEGMEAWDEALQACVDANRVWPGFGSAAINYDVFSKRKAGSPASEEALRGIATASAADAGALAQYMLLHARFADSARACERWMEVDPAGADKVELGGRYSPACMAARAAAGEGRVVGPPLDEAAKAGLRAKARAWVAADTVNWRRILEARGALTPRDVERIAWWQTDGDVACIRDAEWLAKLPADERKSCEALWADVDALLAKARAAAPGPDPK